MICCSSEKRKGPANAAALERGGRSRPVDFRAATRLASAAGHAAGRQDRWSRTLVDREGFCRCDRGRRPDGPGLAEKRAPAAGDRKSTRLNSSHQIISYSLFFFEKKKKTNINSL